MRTYTVIKRGRINKYKNSVVHITGGCLELLEYLKAPLNQGAIILKGRCEIVTIEQIESEL